MKLTRRSLTAGTAAIMTALPFMAQAQDLPRNIRMVIGSTSTGRHLSERRHSGQSPVGQAGCHYPGRSGWRGRRL